VYFSIGPLCVKAARSCFPGIGKGFLSQRPLPGRVQYVLRGRLGRVDLRPMGRDLSSYSFHKRRVFFSEKGSVLKAGYPPFTPGDASRLLEINAKSRLIRVVASPNARHIVTSAMSLVIFPYIFSMEKKGVFLHSMSLRAGATGCLFVGFSGSGKSTLAGLFQERGRDGCRVINDENNLVTPDWKVRGTPWSGTARFANNACAALKALIFHEKGESNRIRPMERKAAFIRCLQCLHMPLLLEGPMAYAGDFILSMLDKVPAYEFRFRKSPATADYFLDRLEKGL
jgi:hypothetical protein